MIDPERAADIFFLNLPDELDTVLLEKGTLSWLLWDNLSPQERSQIHRLYETYSNRITELKVRP